MFFSTNKVSYSNSVPRYVNHVLSLCGRRKIENSKDLTKKVKTLSHQNSTGNEPNIVYVGTFVSIMLILWRLYKLLEICLKFPTLCLATQFQCILLWNHRWACKFLKGVVTSVFWIIEGWLPEFLFPSEGAGEGKDIWALGMCMRGVYSENQL